MARSRNIKPGFFRNADLVELPFEARLLFIGLWTLADRAGRLPDRPKQIKMEIFPADNVDCGALIQAIADTGMLLRYQVGSDRFLQIVNFCKHQNPHRDEKESSIPPPSGECCAPEQHSASTVQAPCAQDGNTVSIGLIPDSLIPDSRFPDRETHATPGRAPDGAARVEAVCHLSNCDNPERSLHDTTPTPPSPTASAVACKAMRAAGMARVNPSSPELAELIAAGATTDALADAADVAVRRGKGFAYALGVVRGQLADAARIASAGFAGNGVPPARASPPEPAWRTEQRQRTLQAVPGIAAKTLGPPPKNVIEIGVENVTAIAMG